MRWLERVSGVLAGALALVAALLSFQLSPALLSGPSNCGDGCQSASVEYGPGIVSTAHSMILVPVALTVAAALVLAVLALLDARRPTRGALFIALSLAAVAVCVVGVYMLLQGSIDVSYSTAPPSPRLIFQYNVGALFIPTLVAALACVLAVLWPRRPALARAGR